ncbi:hypothetical protein GGS21DRAFT_488769 [Xylaria nigripes]|nr:hypothetical protein GGS21DRAFT_488769 [Xylaria nigripes]
MKLRQSNKSKKFGLPDYDSRITSVDSSGDEFVDAASRRDKEQITEPQSEQSEDNYDEGDDDDFDEPRHHGLVRAKANTKEPKRLKRGQIGESSDSQFFSEVPPYPSDPGQRWTRTYIGPIKRWTRFYELIDWWYGDKPSRRPILDGFLKLWWHHELIPPKLTTQPQLLLAQNGWMPANFADNQRSQFRNLYKQRLVCQFRQQTSTRIDKATAFRRFVQQAQKELPVLLGHVTNQKEHDIHYGKAIALSETGHPIDDAIDDADNEENVNGGWLLDMAGIPISMAWAPTQGQLDQLLAIAVIPFSDQACSLNLKDSSVESEQKGGAIHIMRFKTTKYSRGIIRPSRRAPKLVQLLGGSWGRVSRIQWCPAPLTSEDSIRLLGMLCVDGNLGVMGVQNVLGQDDNEVYEQIESPMIVLQPPKEYSVEITCFTWININRIAAGLSDGSVVVWSLSPLRILQRHPVHSTAVMDIVSGYPSDPFLISTVPVGGVITVTDLSRPSAETTYHPNMMVSLQPNLLAWSTHLRGFASMWPSAFAGNPNLTFLPARGFPLCRHLITVTGQPTCINISSCHPFILAGTTDGSVWVFNILRKLSSHREKTLKVKLFQHEFRALSTSDARGTEDATSRGICRVLNGFLPEPNTHPTGMKMAETQRQNRKKNTKEQIKTKGKARVQKKSVKSRSKASSLPEGEVDEEIAMTTGPGPIVLYEPLTRITALAWNPNVEFSCWAAVAMGSGLVRVIDIGAEPQMESDNMGESHEGEGDHAMDMMDESDDREEDSDVDMSS